MGKLFNEGPDRDDDRVFPYVRKRYNYAQMPGM
jgi:hypothetical protein